jgi:hypothetical protein
MDHDLLTKTKTYYHYDAAEDKVTFQTRADVTDLLELNKAQFNNTDERARFGDKIGPGTTVARLPLHVYFELKRKGIADDKEAFAKWLDDPANSAWRTRPGRVSKGLRRR